MLRSNAMAASKFIMAGICCASLLLPLPSSGQMTDQSLANASISFIRTYMKEWSSPNPVALAYMNAVFPDQTTYFGKTLSHAELMQAKRRFAERWPIRRFVVRPDDLSVVCDPHHLCTVWGLVNWRCESPERHADAMGTSVFEFQLQDGRIVTSEDGFVITRGQILPRVPATSPVQPVIYSNADIPRLRQAFYKDSTDPNWISAWLSAARPFNGTARSLGTEGMHELPEAGDPAVPYAIFQSKEGPIGCVMTDSRPMRPPGTEVHLHGTVSIFVGRTMYLSHCSFD